MRCALGDAHDDPAMAIVDKRGLCPRLSAFRQKLFIADDLLIAW